MMGNANLAGLNSPVWFITGCSTGFGRDLARHVLASGYRAVVTAPGAIRVTIHVPASMFLYVSPGQTATLRAPGGAEAQARVATKTLIPNEKGYPVTLVTPESGTEGFAAGMTASFRTDLAIATRSRSSTTARRTVLPW